MNILALDTATTACSAACWSNGSVIAEQEEFGSRRQAEILMPMVNAVMGEAGLNYSSLDLIAVTRGPGSFTGVRIGLATARGLALASNVPLVGITTLEALNAAPTSGERRGRVILATLDARRDQLYGQLFQENGEMIDLPFATGVKSLSDRLRKVLGQMPPLLLVGSGAEIVGKFLDTCGQDYLKSATPPYPRAATIATHIAKSGLEIAAIKPVTPLYLREPGIGPVR